MLAFRWRRWWCVLGELLIVSGLFLILSRMTPLFRWSQSRRQGSVAARHFPYLSIRRRPISRPGPQIFIKFLNDITRINYYSRVPETNQISWRALPSMTLCVCVGVWLWPRRGMQIRAIEIQEMVVSSFVSFLSDASSDSCFILRSCIKQATTTAANCWQRRLFTFPPLVIQFGGRKF